MKLPWCASEAELERDADGYSTLSCTHGIWVGNTTADVIEVWLRNIDVMHPKRCKALINANEEEVTTMSPYEVTGACRLWASHDGPHSSRPSPSSPVPVDATAILRAERTRDAQQRLTDLIQRFAEEHGELTEEEVEKARKTWPDVD